MYRIIYNPSTQLISAVFPKQGAAAYKGAVKLFKRCRCWMTGLGWIYRLTSTRIYIYGFLTKFPRGHTWSWSRRHTYLSVLAIWTLRILADHYSILRLIVGTVDDRLERSSCNAGMTGSNLLLLSGYCVGHLTHLTHNCSASLIGVWSSDGVD